MSANTTDTQQTSASEAAQLASAVPQDASSGVPKKIEAGQTVCNERNAKNKLCNGHLKQVRTGGEEAEEHLRGDDVLFKCQSCGTLYMGPPMGHVRDPFKQERFIERELSAILQAAGGTLPAIKKNEKGVYVMVEAGPQPAHAPAKPAQPVASAQPAAAPTKQPAPAKPAPPAAAQTAMPPLPNAGPVPGETPEQKRARLQALVAAAKARKEAMEAGGEAAPASTATAAVPEPAQPEAATAAPASSPAPKKAVPSVPNMGPVPGETPEQKIARLKALVE